jgi:hypothetical protein
LAERHLAEAESGIHAALSGDDPQHAPLRELLGALQTAIVASHRYPSQAIELVSDPDTANTLHERALG